MATPSRRELVAQAKVLGLRPMKKDTDEEIQSAITAALDNPGAAGFATLSSEQVEAADRIRKGLNVINRTEECFGLSFSSESTSCTERCPENIKCIELLLSREKDLKADEKLRAEHHAEWKRSGVKEEFAPKPMLAYLADAQIKLTPKTKVKWSLKKASIKKLAKQHNLPDQERLQALVDMSEDITTFRDFCNCYSTYDDLVEKVGFTYTRTPEEYFKHMLTAGIVAIS